MVPTADSPRGWSLRGCLTHAWGKFQDEAAPLMLAALAVVMVIGVLEILAVAVVDALTDPLTGDLVATALAATTGFVVLLVAQVAAAGLVRGALALTGGSNLRFPDLFTTRQIVPITQVSAMVSGLSTIGFLLYYVPGVLALHLTGYALFFVIDRGRAPVEAIGDSMRLVRDNLVDTLVWFVVAAAVVAAGALALLVGLVVALPLVLLGTAFTYRLFTGGPIAPGDVPGPT